MAEASGATATVSFTPMTLVTYNDPALTTAMLPTLQRATNNNVVRMDAVMGAEDFSYYAEKVPSLFFYLGGMSPDMKSSQTAPHHTPDFLIDEAGLKTGIKALSFLVVDYMQGKKEQGEVFHHHRLFTHLGFEQFAFHTDDVTNVQ